MFTSYSQFRQTTSNTRPALDKRAVAVLTPEAMQAAMQPPAPDPAAMGGAPMDPAMAGGQPPMDPGMMGGASAPAPMPPDAGAAPMDPGMAAPAPAGGLPPEALQDPLFLQFLAEAFGIMLDPRSGQFFDQNGQPVPPEMLMQAYDAYMQGMQQLQSQGMDPSMMGGQPPMDPAMAGGMPPQGAPMDPAAGAMPPPDAAMMPPDAAMGGAPAEEGQPMDPMMAQFADLIAAVMEDTVVTPMKEEIAALNKQIADLKNLFKTTRDEMDSMKDEIIAKEDTDDKRTEEDRDEAAAVREQLAQELQPTVPQEELPKQAALRPLNILDILGSK